MDFKPTGAALGIEATNVDLRQPLGEADREALRQALLHHGVVFLRNQHLDERQFVDAARVFGEIESYGSTMKKFLLHGKPEIIVLSNIVENGEPIGVVDAGSYWHTDRSYVPKPAWSSCLYALEIPHADDGTPLGDTEFSSMTAAYNALSSEQKARLGELSAWHEYVFRFTEKNDSMPGVRHPVVLRHPVTGAPCLYVNKGFTHRILDLPNEDSAALLEELFEHVSRKEFIYRHRWQVGDVLLWDNYSTQHRATGGYALPQRRHMWRTTIQGFALQ
jgi:taurine dioxygenase